VRFRSSQWEWQVNDLEHPDYFKQFKKGQPTVRPKRSGFSKDLSPYEFLESQE
jgi:hypothetical protein